ncbi:MAG: ketopantoate reductase family protein [Burkholderiales bacterium]
MTTEKVMTGSATQTAPGGWPRVVVFGAGAVGCHFGAKLALAGAPVVLVGRPAPVEAIRARGLWWDSGGARTTVRVEADTSADAVGDAGLVLLCVKTSDTPSAARELLPRLRPGATVVSMQNGVDNVERARAAAPGLDPVAAVVYVGASMGGPGHVVHAGRGDLVLGEVPGGPGGADPSRVARIAATFERAGVPCPTVPDVRAALGTKLTMNAAFNAISALTRARYGELVADAGIAATMRATIGECVAVARAEGVPIDDADALHAAALRLGAAMASATSSTEQDLALGRPTEIDALNGHVAARGEALGVPVPVNRALHALVRRLELGRSAR